MSKSHRLAILSIGFALASATATPAAAQSPSQPAEPAARATQGGYAESPRSFFLKSLLVDAMWVPTETGNNAVGLIGGHLAVANVGRVYVYGPPGVMVLRSGGRVQTSYTWGFSVQVTEFTVPGTHKRAVLYLSLAKCWTHGDQRVGRNVGGISLGWKR